MMGSCIPVVSLVIVCSLLQPTIAEENFYSNDYSQEMLRKLESEIFARSSPMQPTDFLMLYVIELKQGMTVLNDTVSNIGREYHDLWKQEIESLNSSGDLKNKTAQCACESSSSSSSDEVKELHQKVDGIREDLQRVLEELKNLKNAPMPAGALTALPTARPNQREPSEKQKEVSEAVKNYTGHSNWQNVKRSLEYILNPSSTAYKQLEDIGTQETTPLKSAAEKGYSELLEVLLDEGLPVDSMADDVWRYDLLSAAAMSGQVVVVEMLLARGAHTEVTNNRGVTPLMFAASRNHLAVVKALVQHGADVGRRNYDGHTALDLATKRHNREVVDYLSANTNDLHLASNQ